MSFDSEVAEVSGVQRARVEALLLVLLSAVIVTTMKVLGVTLIAAVLVAAATTTRLLTNSFSRMLVLSSVIRAATGALGMYLSYFLDAASGATIVLVGAAVFLVAFMTRGRLGRRSLDSVHVH